MVTAHRFAVTGAVPGIESTQPFGSQDVLHGRGRDADLERDVVSTPAPLLEEGVVIGDRSTWSGFIPDGTINVV